MNPRQYGIVGCETCLSKEIARIRQYSSTYQPSRWLKVTTRQLVWRQGGVAKNGTRVAGYALECKYCGTKTQYHPTREEAATEWKVLQIAEKLARG